MTETNTTRTTQDPDLVDPTRPAAEPATDRRLSTADFARTGADQGSDERPDREPKDGGRPASGDASRPGDAAGPGGAPLFAADAAAQLRERWTDVQAGFVDEPRESVEQADALVAEVMKRLADSFATEREHLEQQWSRGDQASTEDLRVALRRYRSFFDRLLAI